MPTWSVTVTVAGSAATARAVGDLYARQEENAAAVCTLTLIAATNDIEAEREALEGAAVAITCTWDSGAARPWFSGYAQAVTADAETNTLSITATDRLQEWAEAQDEATIDAAVPGSQRRAAIQGARTTGWEQLLAALKTVQAAYAIGRDGVHRCTAWAPGTPAVTLTAADLLENGVLPAPVPLRERINTLVYTVQVRAPVLYESIIDAGFGVGQTFCEWNADKWVPIPTDSVAQAITAAGPLWRHSGTIALGDGSASAINFTRFPPTSTINCGEQPVVWTGNDKDCMAAAWQWRLPWSQTVTLEYNLVLSAPLAVAAHGTLTDERRASVTTETAYSEWDSGSTAGRPEGDWDTVNGVARLVTLDATAEEADLESALAEGAAAIIGSYRDRYAIRCLPWQAQDLDLHHTVRVLASPYDLTGKLAAIERRLSIADWTAETTLTLRRRRGPPGSVTPTPLNAPERPAIPSTWTIANDITFPVRFGGKASAAPYDGTWRGVTTNYFTVEEGAEVYPYRCAFERPAVPEAARTDISVPGVAAYTVHIPRD